MRRCRIFKKNSIGLDPEFIGACDLMEDDRIVVMAKDERSGLYREIAGIQMTGDGL